MFMLTSDTEHNFATKNASTLKKMIKKGATKRHILAGWIQTECIGQIKVTHLFLHSTKCSIRTVKTVWPIFFICV
jgi:hypothetical protein